MTDQWSVGNFSNSLVIRQNHNEKPPAYWPGVIGIVTGKF